MESNFSLFGVSFSEGVGWGLGVQESKKEVKKVVKRVENLFSEDTGVKWTCSDFRSSTARSYCAGIFTVVTVLIAPNKTLFTILKYTGFSL